MKLIKNISLLFLACLVLMSVVPFDVLANDAGDPKIMDPKITATVFADTTTAKPGDVINLTFSIRNDSKRPLYIEEIALESSNIYYEMIDTDYLDIEDQIIDPAETIIVEHKYKTRFDLYSLYAGEMTIVLSPVIHCYYYSPAVNDKQANGRKLYIDINTSIRFTWDFPHDLISPLDIHYEVQKKVNSTSIYNFTVTIQNKSNKTMYDLAIRSNINQIYDDSFSNLKLRSLDPNETKTFYYTYDNESSYRPYYGEIPVVIYLIGEHENDDNLYGNISNIEPLIFHTDTKEKPAIQLEYELICDVKEAHYLEEIPYQLVVYNPTATTFDNIHLQGSGSDDTITIRPKETIIVDLSHLERFDIYDKHLYELFDDTVIIKPPSMKFNEIWYDVDEWWNNYDKSDLLELKISMPPQEENIDVKVFFSSNDKSKIYLQLDNHTGKAIELDFIGCPENAFIKSYFDQNLIKSNHTNLQELTIVADAIIETDEGNFVELFMLFDENSRDSITWLYDLYPVSSSTPTITFTPTHSPSPTSTPYKYDKVEATLKNSGGISKDGTMQNVDVLIFNDMKDQITAITINDHEGNVLHEISGINSQDSVLTNLNVPYKEKLRLRVHYRLANGQKRRTLTNEIYTIKMDQSISDDDPVNVTLYIFIAVLFIIISTTIVIILRKKIKSE